MSIQRCVDTSEFVELCERYNMFLKPLRSIKICVQHPILKIPGQTISSREIIENLKKMVKPDEFTSLKVTKTHSQLIQFEAEVEKKNTMNRVLTKLQSNSMKLNGFVDPLKIRAAAAKLNFPTRHDWDSFFRNSKQVDELRPGERPDTIYFQNLPMKWFIDKNTSLETPSEYILKKVFESFGDIRALEIPSIHTSKYDSQSFKKISSFDRGQVFDAYVQYKEYIGFVKAMDALKGMKLAYKTDREAFAVSIKVDFDKSKYLSDKAMQLRSYERLKIEGQLPSKANYDNVKQSTPILHKAKKHHKSDDESTSVQKLPKVPKLDKDVISKAKLLRQKEATGLLKELLKKAKVAEIQKQARITEQQILEEKKKFLELRLEEERKMKEEKAKQRRKILEEKEITMRQKLLNELKIREQKKTEEIREKLRQEISGKKVLKSVLVHSLDKNNKCHRTSKELC